MRIFKLGHAAQKLDTVFAHQRTHALNQLRHHLVFLLAHRCKVQSQAAGLNAKGPHALRAAEIMALLQQALGGNAATVQASPAKLPGLDQHDLQARAGGPDRSGIATDTTADDQQIGRQGRHAHRGKSQSPSITS